MPNESTTWLNTRARDGSTPIASTISASVIVTSRRTSSGIVRAMNPCMTTCPA